MNRYAFAAAAVAVCLLIGGVVICADRSRPEPPGHAQGQEFAAGRIVVTLPHDLKHRFEFRNDTAERIEITKINPSCGCTDTEAPVRSFEPGESGWMEATATLRSSGPFSTTVSVEWSTGEKVSYALTAVAQMRRELSLSALSIDMDVAESRTMILTYTDQDGAAPGEVLIDASGALSVQVEPWTQVIEANADYGIAARYTANVQIELTKEIESVDHITFSLGSSPELQPAELAIRTPALVKAYASEHPVRRASTGPIQIRHADEAAEVTDAPKSDAASSGR